jgi:hypothetical protein
MPRGGYRPGAGRKKGELGNLTAEMREQLKKRSFKPVDELIDLYHCEATPISDRIKIALEFLQFTAPKLKSVDLAQKQGTNIRVVLQDFKVILPQIGG